MIKQINRASAAAVLMLLIVCGGATALRAQEQTRFGAEEAIQNPAKIPTQIFAMLKRDRRVKQCVAEKGAVKINWFSAAEIDLNGDQTADYVVKAENPCLFGANLAPFWVFHNLMTRYSLVLAANTLGLEVLPEKTGDYRNIKLSRATATAASENIVKFDGSRYH